MPTRTAKDLVALTRRYVGEYDRKKLRDGFTVDEGEADHAILPLLNAFYRSLIPTGFVKCRFKQLLTVNKSEYPLDPQIGLVLTTVYFDPLHSSYKSGLPLDKTRVTSLDGEAGRGVPAWRRARAGVPREWYNDPPRIIGLSPAPSVAGSYIELLAETDPKDLLVEADVPDNLFVGFADELCAGAAVDVLNALGGEANSARASYLAPRAARLRRDVQELAQQRDQNEAFAVRPFERRRGGGYGRGRR